MGGRRWTAVCAVVAALAAPSVADAASTVGIQGDRIVYAGDEGDNRLYIEGAREGFQAFVEQGLTPGPGCQPKSGSSAIECPLAGINLFTASTGSGNDTIMPWSAVELKLPATTEMGSGNDWYDLGGTGFDTVDTGEGDDKVIDGAGDAVINTGPGDDVVWGLEGHPLYENTERIDGGEGNDNLDGKDGDDIVSGGPGDDYVQPSSGNDMADGGDGNDFMGLVTFGAPSCTSDAGDDTIRGGAGADTICGSSGFDDMDGGEGDDLINSLDQLPDRAVACGSGKDTLWADASDPVALDCDEQAQAELVSVSKKGSISVPIACPLGGCAGKITIALAPKATKPQPDLVPLSRPFSSAKKDRLGRFDFKVRKKVHSIKVTLPKTSMRRIKRSGETLVEARAAGKVAGQEQLDLRKAFPARRR